MSLTTLVAEIAALLKPFDEKSLESALASVPLRRAALQAIREKRNEYKTLYAFELAMVEAVGGKRWRALLSSNDTYVTTRLTLDEAAKAAARVAKIADKLAKMNVSTVTRAEATYTTDGFNGTWLVVADGVQRSVKIEVIGAGGYNIQCYHLRVLCTVK